jgi:hypothetical protein
MVPLKHGDTHTCPDLQRLEGLSASAYTRTTVVAGYEDVAGSRSWGAWLASKLTARFLLMLAPQAALLATVLVRLQLAYASLQPAQLLRHMQHGVRSRGDSTCILGDLSNCRHWCSVWLHHAQPSRERR